MTHKVQGGSVHSIIIEPGTSCVSQKKQNALCVTKFLKEIKTKFSITSDTFLRPFRRNAQAWKKI